jgi:hypothetical protein
VAGGAGGGENLRASCRVLRLQGHARSPRRRSKACSQARTMIAIVVSAGFWQLLETNAAPPVTNRFLTSWVSPNLLSTEILGSLPMRAVPISWMSKPGTEYSFAVV